jgi:hypothetical protein
MSAPWQELLRPYSLLFIPASRPLLVAFQWPDQKLLPTDLAKACDWCQSPHRSGQRAGARLVAPVIMTCAWPEPFHEGEQLWHESAVHLAVHLLAVACEACQFRPWTWWTSTSPLPVLTPCPGYPCSGRPWRTWSSDVMACRSGILLLLGKL